MTNTYASRSLKQLLAGWQTAVAGTNLTAPPAYDGPDVTLTRLTEKSSEAGPGSCFVARVRTGSDGHPYIAQAIANGASMILAQRPAAEVGVAVPDHVVYLTVADTAETLAWLAAAWYGFPGRELVVIGVTGTDGKTTTVNIMHQILKTAGIKAGIVSTLKAAIGDEEEPLALHVTTPEAPLVQQYLRRMADAGVTHCVLEVTSIGLAQHRVTAVDFDVAIITNITHEHLDYHQTWDAYADAKARLFRMAAAAPWPPDKKPVAVPKTLVLNLDDTASYQKLSTIPAPQTVTYAIEQAAADVTAADIRLGPWSSSFELRANGRAPQDAFPLQPTRIDSNLFGLFNVYNMLAAAAAAWALGLNAQQIQAGLQTVEIVHGRMQPIRRGQPFLVMVDFAHTPNGLTQAIDAARRTLAHTNGRGRVIAVFGSAGKRDPEKRRLMAEISARDADLTVLTAEDPRTESLDDILAVMAEGCRRAGGVEKETFWRVRDRGLAIYLALSLARPEDLVLICGKGHEQSMCFITTEYPWDDIRATETALDAFLAGEPMPDLGLPTYDAALAATLAAPLSQGN